MMSALWLVGTASAEFTTDEMADVRAEIAGGHWSRIGSAVIRTAANISLGAVLARFDRTSQIRLKFPVSAST